MNEGKRMRWFSRGIITFGFAGLLSATVLNPHSPVKSIKVTHFYALYSNGVHFLMTPAIAQQPSQQISTQQASTQRAIAQQIHNQLPDLPRENHYIHEETGEADTSNTLVHRLIQYHHGVKFRPLTSRFDWKLTLADYMGKNEWIDAEQYPARWLESNPYQSDVAIIQRLNQQQRETLIQALINALSSE